MLKPETQARECFCELLNAAGAAVAWPRCEAQNMTVESISVIADDPCLRNGPNRYEING